MHRSNSYLSGGSDSRKWGEEGWLSKRETTSSERQISEGAWRSEVYDLFESCFAHVFDVVLYETPRILGGHLKGLVWAPLGSAGFIASRAPLPSRA